MVEKSEKETVIVEEQTEEIQVTEEVTEEEEKEAKEEEDKEEEGSCPRNNHQYRTEGVQFPGAGECKV